MKYSNKSQELNPVTDPVIYIRSFLGEPCRRLTRTRQLLSDPRFSVKDSGLSYRTAALWCQAGILNDRRPGNQCGWRKLSATDLVWCSILTRLRETGTSIPALQAAYQSCFDANGRAYLFLDAAILLHLKGVFIQMLVDQKGQVRMVANNEHWNDLRAVSHNSPVLLNFSQAVASVFGRFEELAVIRDIAAAMDAARLTTLVHGTREQIDRLYDLLYRKYEQVHFVDPEGSDLLIQGTLFSAIGDRDDIIHTIPGCITVGRISARTVADRLIIEKNDAA